MITHFVIVKEFVLIALYPQNETEDCETEEAWRVAELQQISRTCIDSPFF